MTSAAAFVRMTSGGAKGQFFFHKSSLSRISQRPLTVSTDPRWTGLVIIISSINQKARRGYEAPKTMAASERTNQVNQVIRHPR